MGLDYSHFKLNLNCNIEFEKHFKIEFFALEFHFSYLKVQLSLKVLNSEIKSVITVLTIQI